MGKKIIIEFKLSDFDLSVVNRIVGMFLSTNRASGKFRRQGERAPGRVCGERDGERGRDYGRNTTEHSCD